MWNLSKHPEGTAAMEGGVSAAQCFPLAGKLTLCHTMMPICHRRVICTNERQTNDLTTWIWRNKVFPKLNTLAFFCALAENWGNYFGRNLFVVLIFSKTSRAAHLVGQLLFAKCGIFKKIKCLIIQCMHKPTGKSTS